MSHNAAFRPAPQVTVWVSSPDTHSERRLDPGLTIAQLKNKFELITGIESSLQSLRLLAADEGEVIAKLDDDERTLASYGVVDWMAIKILNKDPNASASGTYTDPSSVQKFELTTSEYEARPDTLHAYLKANRIGPKYNPDAPPLAFAPPAPPARPISITVGDRCEVELTQGSSSSAARGSVRFVGEVGGKQGDWVGVELDEPVGKNDGSLSGERYFTAKQGYGVFVRPDKVTVGDFPEEDLFDSDEEEI